MHGVSIVQSSVDWTFFRWFVYKQIIFTENRSTWNATNRTSSALYPAGTLASIHWPSQMDISSLYRETSLFFSPWIHLEKHFDQLNSKCECHWIWHRWMISVETKRINVETRRKKTEYLKEKKISTFLFWSFFYLFDCPDSMHQWKWTYDWRSRDTMMTKKNITWFGTQPLFVMFLMRVCIGYWSHPFKGPLAWNWDMHSVTDVNDQGIK